MQVGYLWLVYGATDGGTPKCQTNVKIINKCSRNDFKTVSVRFGRENDQVHTSAQSRFDRRIPGKSPRLAVENCVRGPAELG
jgi:hypothetical protein